MNPEVLSLYSTGKYTSIIIECGHEATQILPVYSGAVMENGIEKYNFGGGDITNFLSKSLQIDYKDATKIKEEFSFVSSGNFKEEKFEKIKYKLPDGKEVTLGDELFTIPEFLFQPNLIGLESFGISKTIQNSIQKCEIDTKKEISESVLLSGGTSYLKGFKQRIFNDISGSYKWKVNISNTENIFSSWLGGSIIVGHQSFNNMWFNKKEYEEHGVKYVHQKCPS